MALDNPETDVPNIEVISPEVLKRELLQLVDDLLAFYGFVSDGGSAWTDEEVAKLKEEMVRIAQLSVDDYRNGLNSTPIAEQRYDFVGTILPYLEILKTGGVEEENWDNQYNAIIELLSYRTLAPGDNIGIKKSVSNVLEFIDTRRRENKELEA